MLAQSVLAARGAADRDRLPFCSRDRKIWAAVQIRRGPNVVGPLRACFSPSPTS